MGLPGQYPACTTSLRDQDGETKLHWLHWMVDLFKSNRPGTKKIYKYLQNSKEKKTKKGEKNALLCFTTQ